MNGEQAGTMWRAFQQTVRRWQAEVEDPSRYELAALVLYPDGSGGVALDVHPGHRPPARLDMLWHDAPSGLGQLGARVDAATGDGEGPGGAELVANLAVSLLVARDRRDQIKARRSNLTCSSPVKNLPPCYDRAGLANETWCYSCRESAKITAEIRVLRARMAALTRELRRHAEASGMYAKVAKVVEPEAVTAAEKPASDGRSGSTARKAPSSRVPAGGRSRRSMDTAPGR